MIGARMPGTQSPSLNCVKSTCQRWCVCLAVTTRVVAAIVVLGVWGLGGGTFGERASMRRTVLGAITTPARANMAASFLAPALSAAAWMIWTK